jgi:hypothetical protein
MTTLGSTIGGLAVPFVPPLSPAATIEDPALDVILGYVTAIFNTYAAASWLAVAPGKPIVQRGFTHDPQDYVFSEAHLPALYIFRTGSARATEDAAEDYRFSYDTVRLFWVMPRAEQDQQRRRAPILPALGKLIDLMIDRGRDPSYVRADDPDPTKTAQGTVLLRAAGLVWLKSVSWTKTTLAIQMGQGAMSNTYQALDVKLELQEQEIQGYDDLASIPNLDLMVSIATGDGTTPLPFSEHINAGSFSSGFSAGFDS